MEQIRSKKSTVLFFLLPAIFLFLLIAAAPLFSTVALSLFKWNVGGLQGFIGIKNYIRLFTVDSTFRTALSNTVIVTVLCVIIQIPCAVVLAYLLKTTRRGKNFFKTSFFLPNVISSAAIGLLWMFIYYPDFGLLNAFLKSIGLESLQRTWLGDKQTALYCVIAAACWQYIGYHMIIHLCAMESIPESIMEAASIDGANSWDMFWRIVLPNTLSILKIDVVLVATGSLRIFDVVFSMTEGGPNHATEVIASHMYIRSFRGMQFGYGSAIAVVLMIICLLLTAVINLAFRRVESENNV